MTAAPRLVSVVIGTKNRPDFLRQALTSIRALEGPDLTFEILVGDNGTSPETPDVVSEFGGIYERTDKKGAPASRNIAMKKATGEFLAFLDDDDIWLPGHIRPHIALMDADPSIEAVFAQTQFADQNLVPSPLQPIVPEADGRYLKRMLSGYFPQVGGTVARSRTLKTYGLMDETLIGDSDWDWQLRIARDHKIGFVDTTCVLLRGRPPGSSDALQRMRVRFTRKIFLRHALPNWRAFRSPMEMLRAFFYSCDGYYQYFMDAGVERAQQGKRVEALRSFWDAILVFPTRSIKALLRNSTVREAFLSALIARRQPNKKQPNSL